MNVRDVMHDPCAVAAVAAALAEDLGPGDATTLALVDPRVVATGEVVAREACRVAGASVGKKVLELVDSSLAVEIVTPDGSDVAKGGTILTVCGKAASILVAERTALNFMQRMCGIATLTSRFVEATREYGTLILDTRKTTPNLRLFEKNAVLCGGGTNHRFGLFDRVLIKDNHIKVAGGIRNAVEQIRKQVPSGIQIEVETTSLEEVLEALSMKVDIIMLDNMSNEQMKACVEVIGHLAKVEASGNMNLERVREVAATGVDFISIGALTHSVTALDISMNIKPY